MNKTIYLKALELEKSGNWDQAHRLIQSYYTMEACWIHAYLHRIEGDLSNAAYWYRQAGKQVPEISLEAEWKAIYNFLNG